MIKFSTRELRRYSHDTVKHCPFEVGQRLSGVGIIFNHFPCSADMQSAGYANTWENGKGPPTASTLSGLSAAKRLTKLNKSFFSVLPQQKDILFLHKSAKHQYSTVGRIWSLQRSNDFFRSRTGDRLLKTVAREAHSPIDSRFFPYRLWVFEASIFSMGVDGCCLPICNEVWKTYCETLGSHRQVLQLGVFTWIYWPALTQTHFS